MSNQNNPRKGKKIVIPGSPAAQQEAAAAVGAAAPAVEAGPPGTSQQRAVLDEIARVQQTQQTGPGQQFDFSKVHLHIGIPC
jgi:hypothetical protein